jgi:hypothetical protein
MDQLKAYSPKHDQLYFTMRFIDGLRHDIKSVVLVQRPKDLDTAATLALLQEEVASASPSKPPQASDWHTGRFAQANKGPLPLPLPSRQDKSLSAAEARESSSSKITAIKSYRKALGLCYKCGAKWFKDHKCSPEVLLAVEAI